MTLGCALTACTGGSSNTDAGFDGGRVPDSGTDAGVDSGTGDDAGQDAGSGLYDVTFHYEPRWAGVSDVSVVGAFGEVAAWDTPLLSLAAVGDGGFSGSTQLPAGTYAYLFKVTGDADANPTTGKQYTVDEANPVALPCPSTSPTASNPENPCSELTVPMGDAAALYKVSGVVTYDGGAVSGYPVLVEREEPGQHHFFANRVTTGASGQYAFFVAPGSYRIQVLHPLMLDHASTDMKRNPLVLQAARRAISPSFDVGADNVLLNPVEMAIHVYDQFVPAPGGTRTLPATFTLAPVPQALQQRLSLYGSQGTLANIGDPWFSSPYAGANDVMFDGGFNTGKAMETDVKLGETYGWGAWYDAGPTMDGGVRWSWEAMPFTVVFH